MEMDGQADDGFGAYFEGGISVLAVERRRNKVSSDFWPNPWVEDGAIWYLEKNEE